MNKRLSSLFLISLVFPLGSCGADFTAKFISSPVEKVTVGNTINFSNYLSYDVGVTVKLTYSNPKKKDVKYDSLYFQTTEVGEHEFKFTFEKGGRSKELECSVNVVPNSPSVSEATNAVFAELGSTVSFDDLFSESGIDALPFGHVNVTFTSLTFTEDYKSGFVSFDEIERKTRHEEIDEHATSYTFSEAGKYVFDLSVWNSEGSVATTLQVSVLENEGQTIEGMSSKGLIKGQDEGMVQLVRSNSSSNLSYVLFNNPLTLDEHYEYSLACEFVGKSAPQMLILSDSLNAKKYSGSGFFLSLEEDQKNQFGIYGMDRFNSKNLSPSRSAGNTFCRKTLLDGVSYRWETHFRKTRQDDGSYRFAIRAFLYADGDLFRTYDWVSIGVTSIPEESYYGFAGSGLDDVTFKFFDLTKEAI